MDSITQSFTDQILRHVRGQRNINFPCSADHEQDWRPYPVDPYSAIICDDHTYIHTYMIGCSRIRPLEQFIVQRDSLYLSPEEGAVLNPSPQ